MKTILVSLLSSLISLSAANFSWAHGAGGGAGGGGAGGGNGGGNGSGHGGGNGGSMGHGSSMSFGHSNNGNTLSTRGSHSHSTLSHHGKSQTKSLAHHSRTHRHSTTTTQLAQNPALPGKKKGFIDGLPPGLELQLDRGRSLPPGWQSKVGPGTVLTDTDTTADKSLPPGQELNADRGN